MKYEHSNKSHGKKMFNTYKSIHEVLSLYRRNRLLSCVTCRDRDYYVVVTGGKDEKLKGMKMFLKHKNTNKILSMHLHEMKIDLSMTNLDLILFNEDDIHNYMLVLPELSIFGYMHIECKLLYYVIDSDYNEMDNNMNMETPKSPGCKY